MSSKGAAGEMPGRRATRRSPGDPRFFHQSSWRTLAAGMPPVDQAVADAERRYKGADLVLDGDDRGVVQMVIVVVGNDHRSISEGPPEQSALRGNARDRRS